MKRTYIFALGVVAGLLFAGCAREDENCGSEAAQGEELVTVSLSYKDISAKEVTVTKATDAENQLNNLQVFIFDDNGRLKGYKYISKIDGLVQDGSQGEVTVKTSTGTSYIYGVANVPTAIYALSESGDADSPLPTSDPTTVSTGKWADWSEGNAQMKQIDFTLDELKKIPFYRTAKQIAITEGNFMMSGAVNGGGAVEIAKDGTVGGDNLIKLRRIVSKVTFNVKTGSQTGKEISFTPSSYDICNVPVVGSLIQGGDISGTAFEDFTGRPFSSQDAGTFNVYLPENIQTTDAAISTVHDREADEEELTDGKKTFTNAPANGTYVVLYGTYSEKSDGVLSTTGQVKYYIHLGNFNTDLGGSLSEFSVNRNYSYEYKVTVNGVNDIKTQVTTSQDGETYNDLEPGAEGLVLDYNGGKSFILDAHYDYCVMKFTQTSIRTLKNAPTLVASGLNGFCFRVSGLTSDGEYATSKTITVTDGNIDKSDLNGVDIDWIRFIKGGTYQSSSPYENIDRHGGEDAGYTELRNEEGYESGKTGVGLTVVELLQHLYEIADDSSKWDKDNGDYCLTYTCYVDENYYETLPWGSFVNKDDRILYIADKVLESKDGRSLYATVAYSLFQHSIQTFYNTEYGDGGSDDIVAFGLEVIRDDGKKDPSYKKNGGGSDKWDGLANMKKDVKVGSKWNEIIYEDFRQTCMSRNRDLDGDGTIDNEEIRWYCPAIDQYGGMWIGENAISDTEARLFNGSTTDLKDNSTDGLHRSGAQHYFSNTKSKNTFWAEEGMAVGDKGGSDEKLNYIRCIRNVKSKGEAIGISADKYYEADKAKKTIDLSRVASSAIRNTTQTSELSPHKERGSEYLEIANARVKFQYASNLAKDYTIKSRPVSYEEVCGETGQHHHYGDEPSVWHYTSGNEPCQEIVTKFKDEYYYEALNKDWSGSMTKLGTDEITPCNAAYSEESDKSDQGTWRTPNQRELCMMYIVEGLKSNESCRTLFSGSQIRTGWKASTYGNIDMDNATIRVRCVKDVE